MIENWYVKVINKKQWGGRIIAISASESMPYI